MLDQKLVVGLMKLMHLQLPLEIIPDMCWSLSSYYISSWWFKFALQ